MNAIQDEDIEALTSLGLTVLQAKVYLTLAAAESTNATIKEISKTAGVARQDLYRITSELNEFGLVEKVITKPATYKALDLTSGIDVLLKDISRRRSESHRKVAKLIQRHQNKKANVTPREREDQFVFVPGKNALLLREKKMLSTAQNSIAFITSKKRFSQKLYSFSEELKKACERGVKIRIIVEETEAENHGALTNKIMRNYGKNNSLEVRYLLAPSPVVMVLLDKKEVVVVACADADFTESPALWSNNPSFMELADNYFETMWSVAAGGGEQAV